MPITTLTSSSLRDPAPPVPGAHERALVASRAHQLGRRRRIAQGIGALAVVAVATVGVAALAVDGSSGPSPQPVAAADAPDATPTVAGTVGNLVPDVAVELHFTAADGTVTVVPVASSGRYVADVAPGDYAVTYYWLDSSGTAQQGGRLGTVTVTDGVTHDFTLP
jgi:hypothetical protein